MDIRTGTIYNSAEDARAAGVDDKHLVTATHRETLEDLKRRLKLCSRHAPHQGTREMARRRKSGMLDKAMRRLAAEICGGEPR